MNNISVNFTNIGLDLHHSIESVFNNTTLFTVLKEVDSKAADATADM